MYNLLIAGISADVVHEKSGDLENFLSQTYATEGGDFNEGNLISASFGRNESTVF